MGKNNGDFARGVVHGMALALAQVQRSGCVQIGVVRDIAIAAGLTIKLLAKYDVNPGDQTILLLAGVPKSKRSSRSGRKRPNPATTGQGLPDRENPLFCEHANEVPQACPCEPDCYCRNHTCRDREAA